MVLCPHCQKPAEIRRSHQITAIVRDLHALCTNDDCGCRFVAQIVAVRIIQPSRRPHPAIALPLYVHARPANDDTRKPANDDRAPAAEAEPVTT